MVTSKQGGDAPFIEEVPTHRNAAVHTAASEELPPTGEPPEGSVIAAAEHTLNRYVGRLAFRDVTVKARSTTVIVT